MNSRNSMLRFLPALVGVSAAASLLAGSATASAATPYDLRESVWIPRPYRVALRCELGPLSGRVARRATRGALPVAQGAIIGELWHVLLANSLAVEYAER
jgi:hypothetical protein